MSVQVGSAYIPVKADLSEFGKDVETGTKAAGGKIKSFAKSAGGVLAGAFAVNAAKDFFGASIAGARESEAIARQTAQVIKTTGGAAGVSAEQIGELSSALSKKTAVDDEVIQTGANLLLTFKNIKNAAGEGNDVFDQTVALGNDMSVALGQDMKSSAIQLGKALNDPIKGVTALQRVGVSFTAQQREQIKTMVEAGDTVGAQKLILVELEDQFGGSAAAQADASKKMSIAWGNLQETIGSMLIPVIDKLIGVLTVVADWASDNPGKIKAIAIVIGGALVLAFTAWAISAAQAAVATIAATWPIIAIGAAIAALIAGIIWAYSEWDAFRNVVDAVARFLTQTVWPAIQAGARWITQTLIPAVQNLIGWFGNLITKAAELATSIGRKVADIVGFFTGLGGKIANAAGDVFGFLWRNFKGVLNSIIRAWNSFKIPSVKIGGWDIPGPGPNVPSFTTPEVNFPNLETLHSGGTVTPFGIEPLRPDEVLAKLQVGETVLPRATANRGLLSERSPLEGVQIVMDGRVLGELMRRDDYRFQLNNLS